MLYFDKYVHSDMTTLTSATYQSNMAIHTGQHLISMQGDPHKQSLKRKKCVVYESRIPLQLWIAYTFFFS